MSAIATPEEDEHRHAGVVDVPAAEVRDGPVDDPDDHEDDPDDGRVARMTERMHGVDS